MIGKLTWLHGREASWVVRMESRLNENVLDTNNIEFLSIVPDTRVPQMLVFKLFSARHNCCILYPREYVLHAQGINVSDAHSENAYSLFSCMWN